MKFKHAHIRHGADRLLVYFNDMREVGFSDHFSLYKQLNAVFGGDGSFDILFIKDVATLQWYLTIIDDIVHFIGELNDQYTYKEMYGFAGSSGCIPLLNILPRFHNFRRAVVLNGQVSLDKNVVSKYKTCTDCCVFDESRVPGEYDMCYLDPLKKIKGNDTFKIRFYHNSSMSDHVNHAVLRDMYAGVENIECVYEDDNQNHEGYIISRYSELCLQEYKRFFLQTNDIHDKYQ